jgi:polynucleotide 5'-hydroxyl-kinase GRC3/NOL9
LDVIAIAESPYEDGLNNSTTTGHADVVDVISASGRPTVPKPVLSTVDAATAIAADEADISLTIQLQNDQSVVCLGEYDVEVKSGLTTVYGSLLRPESGPRRVYAPSTYALPRIVARKDNTRIKVSSIDAGVSRLGRLSPLYRNIWTKGDDTAHSFSLLHGTVDDELQRKLTVLESHHALDIVVSRLSSDAESTARLTRVMAIGAKSSGKSTFNRILVNTLVSKASTSKVFYLDLDPGQPEFGPPGQISLIEVTTPLLGPPFTHPATAQSSRYRLLRSHTVAAMSFKDDPLHYVECAKELIRHADQRFPLVINACGWISGLGASVTCELAVATDVSHVVFLEPLDASLREDIIAACPDAITHAIPRHAVRPSVRTPAESRAMQTMAYFHHRVSKGVPGWSHRSISTWRPWVVRYNGPSAGIKAVLSYGQSPQPDSVLEVLNGAIVALTRIDAGHEHEALRLRAYQSCQEDPAVSGADTSGDEHPITRTPEGIPYLQDKSLGASIPLDPAHSSFVGLALIRGIDVEQKCLHLVTPLPEGTIATLLDEPIAIVRGGFDSPEWAYLQDLHDDGDQSGPGDMSERPWVSKRELVGVEGAVWRLRHPPTAADMR